MNSYKSSTVSSLTGGVASHLSSSSSPPCGNDGQMPFGCHEDDQDHVCQQVGIVTDRTRSFPTLRKAFTRTAATTLFQPWCLSETALLGHSVVFGPDKATEYLRHTLQDGQGIFQADMGSPLWHVVEAIRPATMGQATPGIRNIIGRWVGFTYTARGTQGLDCHNCRSYKFEHNW